MFDDIMEMLEQDDSKMPYIVTGTVIANYNPLQPASVQVSLPDHALGMGVVGWARVAMPFAQSGAGTYSLPSVGDEVAVAFCHGDVDTPIVIGSLFSPLKPPPPEALNPLNNIKCIKTPVGHALTFDEIKGVKLASMTKQGMEMNDLKGTITIHDVSGQNNISVNGLKGEVAINGLLGVTIKVGACEISVDGKTQKVSISGLDVSINGTKSVTLNGPQIKIKGQMVEIASDMTLDVKSSGIANVKGAMLNLN